MLGNSNQWMAFKISYNCVSNYALKHFAHYRCQSNRPVVPRCISVTFFKDWSDISSLPVSRDKLNMFFLGINNFVFHFFQNFGIYIIRAWTSVHLHIIECFQYFFDSYFQIMQCVFRGSCWCTAYLIISLVMVWPVSAGILKTELK